EIPRWIEVGLIAFTLSAFLAWWLVGFSQFRAMREPPSGALRIYVVAKKWMWQAVYENGVAAETDLRMPVGEPIEVLITSRDVIHSFYIPAFRLKEDAVPGRVTRLWVTITAPGIYDLLCAEYCGAGHSRMRGRIIAMPAAEFAHWLQGHDAVELAAVGA